MTITQPFRNNCSQQAGIGNKLVTIFASHLDNFIVKQKSLPLTNIVIPALDRSVLKRQLNLSPGLAKIAPYLPCHRDNFLAKVPGPVAGWLRQVTLTCPYPLAVSGNNQRITETLYQDYFVLRDGFLDQKLLPLTASGQKNYDLDKDSKISIFVL